jgi:hypothetical protein
MVTITTRKIVQDEPRSLNSFKELGILLHVPFCHNLSLLSSRPNWSFITNLLLPPLRMSLCVLVIKKRTTLQSQLGLNITLLQRRTLMIYHLRWVNHLPQLHLPKVLFISNDWVSIQFFALLQRALFEIIPLILMHVLLKTTVL